MLAVVALLSVKCVSFGWPQHTVQLEWLPQLQMMPMYGLSTTHAILLLRANEIWSALPGDFDGVSPSCSQ